MSHEGGHRHARLQQLLEEELASLMRDEVQDPRLAGLRVVGVELSIDYRAARVRYLVDDDSRGNLDRVTRALEKASAFLRKRIGESLDLKRLPQLSFRYDRDAAAEARAQALMSDRKPPLED